MIASSDPNPIAIFGLRPNLSEIHPNHPLNRVPTERPCNGVHAQARADAASPSPIGLPRAHLTPEGPFCLPPHGFPS